MALQIVDSVGVRLVFGWPRASAQVFFDICEGAVPHDFPLPWLELSPSLVIWITIVKPAPGMPNLDSLDGFRGYFRAGIALLSHTEIVARNACLPQTFGTMGGDLWHRRGVWGYYL